MDIFDPSLLHFVLLVGYFPVKEVPFEPEVTEVAVFVLGVVSCEWALVFVMANHVLELA
jgi:hypothetical protein